MEPIVLRIVFVFRPGFKEQIDLCFAIGATAIVDFGQASKSTYQCEGINPRSERVVSIQTVIQ